MNVESPCVVIVGVGSLSHGDDGVGPMVAELLMESGVANVIDAGASPEVETWRIRELAPETVLFVDAVDLGALPGHAAVLRAEDLREDGFDTHRAPLRLTMQYLESELGCKCYVLAVQPKDVRQSACMCDEVRQAGQQLASVLADS